MPKLSVVIITFNEEKNIARCLDSVQEVADEIVVVDSFSTDRTEEICRNYKVNFVKHPFEGYIEQKNLALTKATYDHVLSLDADEALSDKLARSILEVKNDWKEAAYTMNRLTNYCGKWIRHSGWYPDRKMRLFDRTKGSWQGVNPHDKFELDPGNSSRHIKGDILHYSYYTIDDHLKQIEHFTNVSSEALHKAGKRAGYCKMCLSPLAKFIRDYFINLGFLDGKEGYTICRLSARASYIKYHKLKKLNSKKGS